MSRTLLAPPPAAAPLGERTVTTAGWACAARLGPTVSRTPATVLRVPDRPAREGADGLEIAAWSPTCELGWSGRRPATVLLQGCAWQCAACPTPLLRDPMVGGAVPWAEVRAGLLGGASADGDTAGVDAVVLSGGEPTRQDGLVAALMQLRELGLATGLRTSGAYPQRLAAVLPLVDRLWLDIKAPAGLYRAATGAGASAHKAFASLRLALDAGVELQVRTVADPQLLGPADLAELARHLHDLGVRDHVIEAARPAEG
ncbi:radical SAM protein [Actinotalea sp. K2]|uniref:radical SAM protein n=1 Tax=Actinotalea sp. K2 TaxID=2939438 RepID=UPI002017882F|nr:radical SAM protein [Actinotalea sp. K2]MCL3861378.1 radical SAM protein [Actinotalea sp. K2]